MACSSGTSECRAGRIVKACLGCEEDGTSDMSKLDKSRSKLTELFDSPRILLGTKTRKLRVCSLQSQRLSACGQHVARQTDGGQKSMTGVEPVLSGFT